MTCYPIRCSALPCTVWLALSCGSGGQTGDEFAQDAIVQEIRGTAQRLQLGTGNAQVAAADNQDFAWRLLALESDSSRNTIFSPYSISLAAAMLSAGAAGETLAEIRGAMSFSTLEPDFHANHNELMWQLEARNRPAVAETDSTAPQYQQSLRVSNDLWLLPDLRPEPAFLDTLSANYDAGVQLTRFDTEPENARLAINRKVANDTEQLIDELLPPGSLDQYVAMVLTNAIYFQSNWQTKFDKEATEAGSFETVEGQQVTAQFMQKGSLYVPFNTSEQYTAVALPYSGQQLQFVAVMPATGTFEAFVQSLDGDAVNEIIGDLEENYADLKLPKFSIESSLPLREHLEQLGMVKAFQPDEADFSRMLSSAYVSGAFHDAAIVLDEEGTEAAAATAFTISTTSQPPPGTPLVFDQPFVFFLRDVETNATLFVGQYVQPN